MQDRTVSRNQLLRQFHDLGLRPGDILLVHTSFSRVRPVQDGPLDFILADKWLDQTGLQHRGVAGQAEARLARSRDIVEVVSARLRANETVFLHPQGVDSQCDEARQSMARRLN